MSDPGTVGVVTVTYNSSNVIDGFINSLLGQTFSHWLLFAIDNASKDTTVQSIRTYNDTRIRVTLNERNVGVAAGNNVGIREALAAGCDKVLLINNDTEFGKDLIDTLVIGLSEYQCAMTTPKMMYFDDPNRIWCAGGGFNVLKGYSGYHSGEGEVDCGQFEIPRQVAHSPTCCLLVKAEVFQMIGLMDEKYFVYIDDADFTFRAYRLGLKIMYLPKVRILHKVSALTGGAASDFNMRYCTRNHIYFILKNLGASRGLFYLPAYQLHLLMKLVIGKVDVSHFLLKQRAFVEGIMMWRVRARRDGPATV